MHITLERKSPFTGKVNHMELPLTAEEFNAAFERWQSGVYIQDAFHMLNADQREFIKTGITPAEWDSIFGKDEV